MEIPLKTERPGGDAALLGRSTGGREVRKRGGIQRKRMGTSQDSDFIDKAFAELAPSHGTSQLSASPAWLSRPVHSLPCQRNSRAKPQSRILLST